MIPPVITDKTISNIKSMVRIKYFMPFHTNSTQNIYSTEYIGKQLDEMLN